MFHILLCTSRRSGMEPPCRQRSTGDHHQLVVVMDEILQQSRMYEYGHYTLNIYIIIIYIYVYTQHAANIQCSYLSTGGFFSAINSHKPLPVIITAARISMDALRLLPNISSSVSTNGGAQPQWMGEVWKKYTLPETNCKRTLKMDG